jgi:cytochrome c553
MLPIAMSARLQVISARAKAVPLVVWFLASGSLLAVSGSVCAAGDVKAGRAKALMCQACHGIDGLSKVPDAPNIAAQTEPYIVAQLQAFKSGTRKNEAMSMVAPSLSNTDIEDLAAYFSAIEIKVVKLPLE